MNQDVSTCQAPRISSAPQSLPKSERSLFFEPLAGRRRVKVTEHRTRIEWAQAVRELVDEGYPQAHDGRQ